MRILRTAFLGLLSVGLFALASPASAAVVTAGMVTGIGGDSVNDAGVTLQFFDDSGDGVANVVLDLGSALTVTTVQNVNRTIDTNLAALGAEILIAVDEGAVGFDPSLVSSFTTSVFDGDFSPVTNAAGEVRDAVLSSPQNRQYFLIRYSDTLTGPLGPGNTHVQVSDLRVVTTAIPEPSSLILGGLAVVGLAAGRRRTTLR